MQTALGVSADAPARADLRRRAADHGLLRRRAEEGLAADPAATPSGSKKRRSRRGEHKGAWAYPVGPAGGGGDPSNSQFALLALYEAERAGIKVNDKTWRLALQYWQAAQNPDGSWGYSPGQPRHRQHDLRRHHVADHRLGRAEPRRRRGRRRAGPLLRRRNRANDAIENGLRWLERNFSVHTQSQRRGPRSRARQLAAVLPVRRRTRRPHDGTPLHRPARLVSRRGRHAGPQPGQPVGLLERHRARTKTNPHIGTSFALLFLAKGRRPVLVAKLKHGPDDDWNHHRSDLANLTSYVEKKWERDLTWQVIDPAAASVEDLLQAPVLFFNGRAGAAIHRRAEEAPARLRRSRRLHLCRGLLRRRRVRSRLSQADERSFSRAGIQAAAVAARASDLACRGTGRSPVRAAAVGHRHRLPHERRLLPERFVVLLGAGPRRARSKRLPEQVQAEVAAAAGASASTCWPMPRIAS